jgi:GTP cyclohydrolase I
MASMQDSHDDREIALDRVGVVDLVYPVIVPGRAGGEQTTEATVGLFVGLPPDARGAHMSRFVEVLHAHRGPLTTEHVRKLLTELRNALSAASAHMELEFTYFVERKAPLSGSRSLLAVATNYEATLDDAFDLVLSVEVPVMTVCPCSKEATGGPAHSQRGYVTVSVRFAGEIWIEELVELVDDSGSGPVLPLLKAEDERSIIEIAHENPLFVEDLARNVAERLDSDVRVYWYRVQAVNLESVHDHNVYACVERRR